MFIVLFILLKSGIVLSTDTICGKADERRLSDFKEIGRAIRPDAKIGCTLTLVGRSCAISAGHCKRELQIAQFNTYTDHYGKLIARAEDIYEIDQRSMKVQNDGHGKDWSVMKLRPNSVTNLLPGDVQGFLTVSWVRNLTLGAAVTITGHGRRSMHDTNDGPQQTHTSFLLQISGTSFYYDVDTMGGSSGSAVVNDHNQIIGVHTHGYCSEDGGANQGTILSRLDLFKAALKDCLRSEQALP